MSSDIATPRKRSFTRSSPRTTAGVSAAGVTAS